MNYKAGKVWFAVPVTPEFCIRMDVDSLMEWIEHRPGKEMADTSLRVSSTLSEI